MLSSSIMAPTYLSGHKTSSPLMRVFSPPVCVSSLALPPHMQPQLLLGRAPSPGQTSPRHHIQSDAALLSGWICRRPHSCESITAAGDLLPPTPMTAPCNETNQLVSPFEKNL